MKHLYILQSLCLFLFGLVSLILAGNIRAFAQEEARIGMIQSNANEVCLAINPITHERFGAAYPLTFRFSLPTGAGVSVERKYDRLAEWVALTQKSESEVYNAIEVVRIDSSAGMVYVSVAFDVASDSIFLRFTSGAGAPLTPHYLGMPRYYDGRHAAVTVTADDWANWFGDMYPPLLSLFRSYGLYVTAGVITSGVDYKTQLTIQRELDSGYVEVAAHSRTHPSLPYSDYTGEVLGCIDGLLNYLTMPPLFRRGDQGYLYVWIAPNGRTNATIDSLLTLRNILVNRLYGTGDTTFSAWSPASQKFLPMDPTLEIGNPSWGGGETRIDVLNATFDSVTARGGIYHFMWHPQTLYPDIQKTYLSDHLKHVSGRSDLWYVNLGHLYLYHYFQMANGSEVASVPLASAVPEGFKLEQNYPNPFNPSTRIQYTVGVASGRGQVAGVKLVVYDLLGREVAVLVNERKAPGSYEVSFDGNGLASGVYICRMTAGSSLQSKKMMLMK